MSVVVGFVPTPEGAAALEQAIRSADELGTGLVVVNVTRGHGLRHEAHADDTAYLEQLGRDLEASGLPHIVLHPVGDFDPSDEILQAAERHGANLIVLGLRRRTPVGKLFLGSTSQRVLLEAECPVLAVKAHHPA